MSFGDYLRELRKARGMAKNRFANLLGVPYSTVDGWERRGATPQKANLAAIVDKLQLDRDEKKKLTDLWLTMPSRRRKGAVASEAESVGAGKADAAGRRQELEALLTRALVPGKHTLSDGVTVLGALADALDLILTLGATETTARVWLDAAAVLRERGIKKVTAAQLAVVIADQHARQRPNHTAWRSEAAPADAQQK